MTTTEPTNDALSYACPFCHADPGQPCRTHRGRGPETGLHSRRIAFVHERPQVPRQQALCCKCGQLRTVSKNHSLGPADENKGGGMFSDPRGWFHTGTLKCSHCGTRTRHALIEHEESVVRDLAEEYQRYVLGGKCESRWAPDLERLRVEYFAQFPRNPFVNHRWWKSDENAARAAGKQWFRSMCGEMVPLPEQVRENGRDITAMEAPTHVTDPDRTDHENLDVEAGLWWTEDGECVNCLKVRNEWLLKQQRTELLAQLLEVSAVVESMDAIQVTELREHVERLMSNIRGTDSV